MRDPTLKNLTLTNAKPVKRFLARHKHCTDMEDSTQDRSLANTSCLSKKPVILTQLTGIIPVITEAHHYQHPLPEPKPETAKALSCWICQEEHLSESLLIEHYEDHMRNIFNYINCGHWGLR